MSKDLIFNNELVQLTFRSDKILHIHYITEDMTIENSKFVLQYTRTNSPWKISTVFLTGSNFMTQSKESRDFNSSAEVLQYCSAIAFLADSLAQKLLANFFVSMNKNKIPMRFFDNTADALKWLSQFKTISNNDEIL